MTRSSPDIATLAANLEGYAHRCVHIGSIETVGDLLAAAKILRASNPATPTGGEVEPVTVATMREAVQSAVDAVAFPISRSSAAIASVWTPQQFWEYVEGLTDSLVRDQIRDMLASTGLTVTNVSQTEPERLSFIEAMSLAERGLEIWKAKDHNAKWWRRIDGTPISNDLLVNIAEEFAKCGLVYASSISSTEGK